MVKVISRQSVEINGARQGSQRKMSTNANVKYYRQVSYNPV